VHLSSQDVESSRSWVILSKFVLKELPFEISKVFVPLPELKHDACETSCMANIPQVTDSIQRNIGITEVDLRQVS
jgi:hypothetical protein